MSSLRNVYRRYALAGATFSCAISISFLMQASEAQERAAVSALAEAERTARLAAAGMTDDGAIILSDVHQMSTFPSLPAEDTPEPSLPDRPVFISVAKDAPVAEMLSDALAKAETGLSLESTLPDSTLAEATLVQSPATHETDILLTQDPCDVAMTATPAAGALVTLDLDAACLGGEQVTIHHAGMKFSEIVGADGAFSVTVPALQEGAVFIASFLGGEGAVAKTRVETLRHYDRVVVQWQGKAGLELHALEFGANHGDAGHVWSGAARDISAMVNGEGGFLVRLGDDRLAEGLKSEVYTFPSGSSKDTGSVVLSVEAEVRSETCGREVAGQTIQMKDGSTPVLRDIAMMMPDCDALGQFLVLKNLLEDLTIASN